MHGVELYDFLGGKFAVSFLILITFDDFFIAKSSLTYLFMNSPHNTLFNVDLEVAAGFAAVLAKV